MVGGGVECRVRVAPADVLTFPDACFACTALSFALPADHSASVDRPTLDYDAPAFVQGMD